MCLTFVSTRSKRPVPSSETPAKSPLLLEYENIGAGFCKATLIDPPVPANRVSASALLST
jgi:hypothetical protein